MLDIGSGNGKDGFGGSHYTPLETVYWLPILWFGIKHRQMVSRISLKLPYFVERQSIGRKHAAWKPTIIMGSYISWHLPLQKILKSVFLIFREWIAGWIKYEKVIRLHWPVDRGKCPVGFSTRHLRTVAVQWRLPVIGSFTIQIFVFLGSQSR